MSQLYDFQHFENFLLSHSISKQQKVLRCLSVANYFNYLLHRQASCSCFYYSYNLIFALIDVRIIKFSMCHQSHNLLKIFNVDSSMVSNLIDFSFCQTIRISLIKSFRANQLATIIKSINQVNHNKFR